MLYVCFLFTVLSQLVTRRGITHEVCISIDGISYSGMNLDAKFEWMCNKNERDKKFFLTT